MEDPKKTHFIIPLVGLDLPDSKNDGLILDVESEGEGVTGKLKGEMPLQ